MALTPDAKAAELKQAAEHIAQARASLNQQLDLLEDRVRQQLPAAEPSIGQLADDIDAAMAVWRDAVMEYYVTTALKTDD